MTFKIGKLDYYSHVLLEKALKGAVVNQQCHRLSEG